MSELRLQCAYETTVTPHPHVIVMVGTYDGQRGSYGLSNVIAVGSLVNWLNANVGEGNYLLRHKWSPAEVFACVFKSKSDAMLFLLRFHGSPMRRKRGSSLFFEVMDDPTNDT